MVRALIALLCVLVLVPAGAADNYDRAFERELFKSLFDH